MSFEFINYSFLNNTILDYLISLGIFFAVLIGLRIFRGIVVLRLKKISEKTKTDIDDLLVKIIDSVGSFFYMFLSFYIAIRPLNFRDTVFRIIGYFLFFIIVYYIVKAIQSLIDYGTNKLLVLKQKEGKELDKSVIDLLAKILKGIVWAIAIIILLQNLGYNISALVAGLGIGGIAIAFALQNILGDLFASFAIYFDKPFQTGDFIIVGKDMGTVNHVGIKSTRLQSLQGEEIIVSNKELTEARIHNYKKMEKRRIAFVFGLTYETSTEKLRRVPSIIEKLMADIELADLDRAHFKEFADFSLNFEVVYYLNSSDYNKYMDTQQEINLKIKEAFEIEGIEMAYPTQKIFINK
jgi:small-conductance mechanosensitive channel